MSDPLEQLYQRPGFLIRRAHQISVALFQQEAAELGGTTTQFGALYIIHHHPGIDQIGLASLGGFDRSTTAMVVRKLEEDGALIRTADPEDRRRKTLRLTKKGEDLLDSMYEPAAQAQQRSLEIFTQREAERFLQLLDKFVSAHNDAVRTKVSSLRDKDKSVNKVDG
ncbi:MAG: MarR family transcriptional regulator [Erythrobacter sp.]|uniref:MarR family winged helix-turn-helix transcriptional regulator n=1 Tax=Erythrobacter sp. TaxID=1042 RepID=UPI002637A82A|nr:MarR family transcriptional regulator [Erythrobacter sp.]MDJ0978162.1 MarR family transcriptional regulator [Erythrobacter sp.]